MKNKKGMWLSIYWFIILAIIAAGVGYMVVSFYGAPYDVRKIEADILTSQIADCLAEGGYLRENVLSEEFKDNFLEKCKVTFKTENEYGWREQEQYYLEINFYEFEQNISDGLGKNIFNIVKGNVNLVILANVENIREKALINFKREVDTIVIHSSEIYSAEEKIKELREKSSKIHYMIDRDGFVISEENEDEIFPIGFLSKKAFVSEKKETDYSRCNAERPFCHSDVEKMEPLKYEQDKDCCRRGFINTIEIELVNLGQNCERTGECINKVEMDGIILENYTEYQIDSLASLVADISLEYNILADRNHIIGHEEIDSSKKFDPGLAFPWDYFIEEVKSMARISNKYARNFYVLDKEGNQYVIKILALVKKTEENVV